MHLFDAAKNIIQYTRSNNGQGNDRLDTLIVAGCWNGSPSSWMTSTCQRSITGRTCCTWAAWRRTPPSSSGFSTSGQTYTGTKQPGTEHHLWYLIKEMLWKLLLLRWPKGSQNRHHRPRACGCAPLHKLSWYSDGACVANCTFVLTGYVSWGEYPMNFAAVLNQEEIYRWVLKNCKA